MKCGVRCGADGVGWGGEVLVVLSWTELAVTREGSAAWGATASYKLIDTPDDRRLLPVFSLAPVIS